MLTDKSNALKNRLSQLLPDEYTPTVSRGRRGKNHRAKKNIDHGYFICSKCRGMFEYKSDNEEVNRKAMDSFNECSQHRGRKNVGTLTYKKEMEVVQWL